MVLVFLKFISQSYDMEWYPLNDQIAILILVEMDFENPLLAKKKITKNPLLDTIIKNILNEVQIYYTNTF